jgi:hypothetical protein
MTESNFIQSFKSEISAVSKQLGVASGHALAFWFAKRVLEISDEEALEAISLDGANDKGIDFFYVDGDNTRIIVAQVKYSDSLVVNVKEAHLHTLQASLNWLTQPESLRRDGRPDLAAAAEDYLRYVREGYSVELWFIYTAPQRPGIQRLIDVYNKNPENVEAGRAIRHFSLDQLRSEWLESAEQLGRRITKETIRLASNEKLPFTGTFGQAVVICVPGSELKRLYVRHRDVLFDRNVRLFLGNRKGSVNASISQTIEDNNARGNFWAYNNGITMICDDFEHADGQIEIHNFNIINGCQTTVSLARSDVQLDDIQVLTRIIKPPREIIDEIIKFNNSQNPIKVWDIASQNKTQRRLKIDFEKLSTPWIYLTRRGSRPTEELRRFRDADGKLRLIEFEEAGQHSAAYRGLPVLAYKDKAAVFTRYHDEVFPKDVRCEEVLFHHLCGLSAREATMSELRRSTSEESRILKKGGGFFVLAIMGAILEARNGATFLSRMEVISIMSKRTSQRLQNYAVYSLNQFMQAATDETAIAKEEYSTLVRSAEFFIKVRNRVLRNYRQMALSTKWLDDALPKIGGT